jgi:3-oxoacyl-[acyl-carrier-protein] synthase-3
MTKAYIKHITIHTPQDRVTNEDLAKEFSTEPELIFKRTGIKNRFIVAEDEICSDLARIAGDKLFEEYPNLERDQIDFLLYCTSGLDYVGPATACLLHHQLGLRKNAGAMDIPMGCAGFTNGLIMASSLIASGAAKNILFIVADFPTTVLHKEDLYLRELFSDAAAATLISTTGDYEIGKVSFGTDGGGKDNLIIKGSGVREPLDGDWIKRYADTGGLLRGRMEMNGAEILKFSLREMPGLFAQTLEDNNCKKEDIDLFIFHHASAIIIKFLIRKLGIDPDKVFTCLEEYGNTVSASVPIAMYEAQQNGAIKDNSTIFIAGFGIGYSWSATILKTTNQIDK